MPFKPFSTRPEFYYAYDMSKNKIFKLSKVYFDSLNRIYDKTGSQKDHDNLKYLQGQNMFGESSIQELEHPATNFVADQLQKRLSSITVQLSQDCNLRCGYCPYSVQGLYENRNHNSKSISWETLRSGIDFLLNNSSEVDELNISFYGGEPLLEKQMIYDSIDYINSKITSKRISYNVTTNGTLLDLEFIQKIMNHNFMITVSLDGSKEDHDRNRKYVNGKGSFNSVVANISKIKERYPKMYERIRFNTVLSPESNFSETFNFFRTSNLCTFSNTNFNTLSTNYTTEIFEYNQSFFEERNYQTLKANLILLKKLKNENIADHKNEIELIFAYKEILSTNNYLFSKAHPGGTCVPGLKKLFMDVNGSFFPCERIDENSKLMNLGNVRDGLDVSKVKKVMNIGSVSEGECKECWAFHLCSICPAMIDDGINNQYSKELKMSKCDQVRESALNKLKDYVMLKEFKFNFDEEII